MFAGVPSPEEAVGGTSFHRVPACGQLPLILPLEMRMHRVPDDLSSPLHDLATVRLLETSASPSAAGSSLMAKAGLATARLAQAIAPSARTIWVACGPGNNGGDGLHAAAHLHRWVESTHGRVRVVVTHPSADPASALAGNWSPEVLDALEFASRQGVRPCAAPPLEFDLAIDALFGIGLNRPLTGNALDTVAKLRASRCPVLSVDIPSGLDAMTGAVPSCDAAAGSLPEPAPGPRFTLTFLTLKPGLFMGRGRDLAGEVWFDDLGANLDTGHAAVAWLHAEPRSALHVGRAHAGHKGSQGEVVVVGGQDISVTGEGMTGAALLAARAALNAGSGRVYVSLLGSSLPPSLAYDPAAPELMFRRTAELMKSDLLDRAVAVCGCGAGQSLPEVLPELLARSPRLVLDADALNAIARSGELRAQVRERTARGWLTVMTPHPLEAARLLGNSTSEVMNDRLAAAQRLVDDLGVVAVLKGSGTVVASPNTTPRINPTGGPALATAGTGDVLAGMLGAALGSPRVLNAEDALAAVLRAVHQHGWLADHWPVLQSHQPTSDPAPTLTASRLANAIRPLH